MTHIHGPRASAEAARIELTRARAAFRDLVARQGAAGAAKTVMSMLVGQALLPLTVRRRRDERFDFDGVRLPYTLSRYNNSFRNERSIEVSVARWFLAQQPVGRMLEVGNVLGHYGMRGHEVIDRYETLPGVLNVDIVDFASPEPYDTVVSISTLEHVGRDEVGGDARRAVTAFDRVVALTSERGRILVTIPIGYNAALDEALAARRIRLPIEVVMCRVDGRNRWLQTSLADGLRRRYGSPFNNANAVYFGMRAGVDDPETGLQSRSAP